MANHVYFTINVEGITDEQFNSEIKTETRTAKNWNDEEYTFEAICELEEQPFMDVGEKLYTEQGYMDNAYDWYCEHVGAKWCHVEECEDNYISGYSAWRQPHEMVLNMIQYFARKYDTEVSATMTYEDEFRNFLGKQYYGSDKCEDDGWYSWDGEYNETDNDALISTFNERFPDIDTEDDDFDWHEEVEVNGETIYPSEVLDEIVDEFWESC